MQGCLNEEMKVDGWISLILSNRECVVLKYDTIGENSYNEESTIEEGIVDLDSGTRFEGRLLKEDKIGIPFGFGEMYDDDGKLIYKGILINWKQFGYGVNYHDNGEIEYEGYWCDDERLGKLEKECVRHNGNNIDIDIEIDIDYEGNGSINQ